MKTLLFYLFISGFITPQQINIAEITKAISQGDISTLGRYLDNSVELGILDKEDIYNQQDAVKLLKEFFDQYPPKSYSPVHQGTSQSQDSIYCIGNLVTNQATFRVYIYMRVSGEQHLIQEIRLDKE